MSDEKKSSRLNASGVLDQSTARKELRDMIKNATESPSYSVEDEYQDKPKKVRRFKDGTIVYE